MRPEFITDPRVVSLLEKNIDRSGGPEACWPWTYTRFANGYGCLVFGGKTMLAHRVMKAVTVGRVLERFEFVCHTCDNPICCNPSHHFIGSPRENSQDALRKGRIATGLRNGAFTHPEKRPAGARHGSRTKPESLRRGEANSQSRLRSQDVVIIRERLARGDTMTAIAKDFGVSRSTIGAIRDGHIWKHVA